ncbi:MAG: histidinol phosphate phosphatase domain-containing protein [Desulfovibrionaceae bacterium]|nr:histidinol phosphate phosphatase domain-containing protein [Desulfovibrionaceae bacterium]
MLDLHVHIAPDGQAPGLLPAEALRLAALRGLRAVGLVVRSDGSLNLSLRRLGEQVRALGLYANVDARVGVELIHVPPALLPEAVADARKAGAELVLVHGESLADTVAEGTNLAAVEAGADILAHPGLVDDQTAAYAAEKGVALELSACPRHCLTNAHVAAMAERHGCLLAPGGNAHTPEEFLRLPPWMAVCQGAAFSATQTERFRSSTTGLMKRLMEGGGKTL